MLLILLLFWLSYRFEMLKTPDGNISGSLKVVQSHKKGGDWTWKEQVNQTYCPFTSNLL